MGHFSCASSCLRTAALLAVVWLAALAPVLGSAAEGPRWGWLGVRIRDLGEHEMEEISARHGIREGFGAMIVEVIKDAPAAASGLRSGDIVVAVTGRPVVDTRSLQRFIAGVSPGETVGLTVLRREEGRRPIAVRLAPMPDPVVAERVAVEFGFVIRDPDAQPEIGGARPAGLPTVGAVLRGSRAEAAGLRPGDVLVEVDGRLAPTVEAVREVLRGVSPDQALPLTVRREGDPMTLLIAGSRPR
jgi:serine protease Do